MKHQRYRNVLVIYGTNIPLLFPSLKNSARADYFWESLLYIQPCDEINTLEE